jgi:hypothetical protein
MVPTRRVTRQTAVGRRTWVSVRELSKSASALLVSRFILFCGAVHARTERIEAWLMSLKFVKPERILLSNHPEYRETWVQERIAEDPSILGLGDLVLKDKERNQPRGGRLDLLLQDAESSTRYEVEVMLGGTDESHIIRTIEYWDVEKKRYPQYDHYAVLGGGHYQ